MSTLQLLTVYVTLNDHGNHSSCKFAQSKLPTTRACQFMCRDVTMHYILQMWDLQNKRFRQCVHVCLSVYLTIHLSVCLSFRLSVCLSGTVVHLSVCPSVHMSVSVCVSDCISVCLPVCLSVSVSDCPSVCPCVCLSVNQTYLSEAEQSSDSQLQTLGTQLVNSAHHLLYTHHMKKGKGSPDSITERRVPQLIPVLGSQPAGDVNHKPGGRLPLFSARPGVTSTTLKRAAISFAAW